MNKRLRQFLILAVICFVIFPSMRVKADVYTGSSWSYDSTTKTLTISNDITEEVPKGYVKDVEKIVFEEGVTSLSISWDSWYYKNLQEVIIPSTVECVRAGMFENCRKLRKVTISEGVKEIGENAFFGCDIGRIEIPDSVTKIGEDALGDIILSCDSSGNSVWIGKDIYVVCNKSSAAETFAIKKQLPYIYYGETSASTACGDQLSWDLDYETGILRVSGSGDMYNLDQNSFCYSKRLFVKKVIIDEGVTSIGDYAFADCYNLESVFIPNTVTSIGKRAFHECEKLKNIDIPDGVTSIGDRAFRFCSALSEIHFPDALKSIGELSFGESGIQSVTLANNVSKIGDAAFMNCEKLTYIKLPTNLTVIPEDLIHGCKKLRSVSIPKSVKEIRQSAFADTGLTKVTIPSKVTKIGDNAFAGSDLASLVIPDSVTTVGGGLVSGCNKITKVTFGRNVKKIGDQLFRNCKKLKTIDFKTKKLKTVTKGAFYDVKKRTKIKVPSSKVKSYKALFRKKGLYKSVKVLKR